MVVIALGVFGLMGFWLMIGYGFVTLSPEVYFYFVTQLGFCLACSKGIDLIEYIRKPGPKDLFDISINVAFIGFCVYIWYAACLGVNRVLQGLSPIQQEPKIIDGIMGLIYGFGIAAVVIGSRELYLKWKRKRRLFTS